jgi:hypothetical protein
MSFGMARAVLAILDAGTESVKQTVRPLKEILLLLALCFPLCLVACSSQQAQTRVQRQPMEKQAPREYKTPEHYEPRVSGTDPKTGQPITYDHKPRVEVVDARAGRYAFKWIGFDGSEKTATFYRTDAVDVLVSASVLKLLPDQYQYSYEVKNLPSSGTWLKRFIVQTFTAELKQAFGGQFSSGFMSQDIKAYSVGKWIDFADASDHIHINPGQSVMIQFTSPGPPGLVECRAGAESEIEGADEEMPNDIAPLLNAYGEYLRGWTVGPVDELKSLSTTEKARYLLDKLPQFRKLGWITDEAFSRYDKRLKNGDLNAVFAQIDQDLKSDQIATEVFAIIQAMK